MQRVWKLPSNIVTAKAKTIARKLNLHDFVVQILLNRGLKNSAQIKSFMDLSLNIINKDINLPQSKNIMGIDKTCKIIKDSIKANKQIQLYDDYDADGITSGSIMYILIHDYLHYDKVNFYIPNRFTDGYGPNLKTYQKMYKHGMQVLITTDNGISGLKQITWLKKHGVTVIITDHHDWPVDSKGHVIKSQVPPADAICMANCPDHPFHSDGFCGAGIAFMIACRMLKRIPMDLLDLVCLGTIGDRMDLSQHNPENRALVANGVKQIQHDTRKGVRALAGEANTDLTTVTAANLGFNLIPRLNAIGRMADANLAANMLITHDTDYALQAAKRIESYNNGRKEITKKVTVEAMKQANLPQNRKRCTLVLHSQSWYPGIVGIVAANVSEKTGKPTLVIGHMRIDDKTGIDRGSGRSIGTFNLFSAMSPLQRYDTKLYRKRHPHSKKHNVMTSFGGHPFACGFSIMPDQIGRLSKALEVAGHEQKLQKMTLTVKPDIMLRPKDITTTTLNEFQALAPFGEGNPLPLVDLRVPYAYNITRMGDGSHMSFTLGSYKHSTKVVAFGMGDLVPKLLNNPFDVEIAGHLSLNHYMGYTNVQFMAKDIKHYTPCPSRADFKIVYYYLKHHPSITFTGQFVSDLVQPLATFLKMQPNQISVILQIFQELHLISYQPDTQTIVTVRQPKPCNLKQSQTYRQIIMG